MSKNIENLTNAINQVDLINIYKTLHLTTAKYIFKCTQNFYHRKQYSGP